MNDMVNRLTVLIISILIVCLVLGFVIYRTVTTVKIIKLAERSAINYAEQIYEDVDFRMAYWYFNFDAKVYTISLYDPKYKGVRVSCIVTPTVGKDGYYDVRFFFGRNIDLLPKKEKVE